LQGSRQMHHEKDADLAMHLDISSRNKAHVEHAENLW